MRLGCQRSRRPSWSSAHGKVARESDAQEPKCTPARVIQGALSRVALGHVVVELLQDGSELSRPLTIAVVAGRDRPLCGINATLSASMEGERLRPLSHDRAPALRMDFGSPGRH